jgi:SNF2 family DNA or RNA helicase
MTSHRPSAEVCITETLECLCLVPLKGWDRQDIRQAIRSVSSEIPLRSTAAGVMIPAQFSHLLLDLEGALELKWAGMAKRFVYNRRRLTGTIPSAIQEVERIKSAGVEYAEGLIKDLPEMDQLDAHQKINVAAMTLPGLPGLCLFDEQGAGKTVTLIFTFDLLVQRDEVDIALIIAPKSMVGEWPNDIIRFKRDLYKCVIIAGNKKEKGGAVSSDGDIFITNFETAVSMEKELSAMLRRHGGRAVLVVDESFFVKNLDAKRTRSMRRLREYCDRAYVLCGTPAPNSAQDIVQQFNIADFGTTFAGITIPADRESARPIIQNTLERRGVFLRHLKRNVLPELPLKRFHRILVPLQPLQARLYKDALSNLIVDLQSTGDQSFRRQLPTFLARRSALLQICSNPVSIFPDYSETPAKLGAMDDILGEIVTNQGEKVVLWSFYTASIDAIVARYQRFNPVRYDGKVTSISERHEAVRRFQEDPDTMLFIGNPAAAGAGLTLHKAKYSLYESMSNQAAHYCQSVDRIHRRGQTRAVEYLIALCERTIEIAEYNTILKKERAGQELLGDRLEESLNRETMLTEMNDLFDIFMGVR